MTKNMALYVIGVGAILLIGGITMLGLTTGGLKPIHYIAVFAVLAGIATLFKEISSSLKTDSIKQTVETSQKSILEIEANTIGGDSYCYVLIYPVDSGGNPASNSDIANVMLIPEGKFPLHNLHISIVWQPFMELPEFLSESNQVKMFQDMRKNSWEIPTINETSPRMTYNIAKVPWRVNGAYTISFDARNGHWFQVFRVKQELGHTYTTSYEVRSGMTFDGEMLKEKQYTQ